MTACLATTFLLTIISLVYAKTTDCNYVVDVWYLNADPPSLAPTNSPTDDPTSSPTNAPTDTNMNETVTTQWIDSDYSSKSEDGVAIGFSVLLLLNPYPIESCYSFNFTQEPINYASVYYSCDSNTNTLTRTLYWDSLNCDGNDMDIQQFTEQGPTTSFVCNASYNCPATSINILRAFTESPTMEPTDSPTFSPTNAPTFTGENTINTQYPQDGEGSSNGASSNSGFNCNNTLGPNGNDYIYSWQYATDVCLNSYDLPGLINGSQSEIASLSWTCIDNIYTFGVYTVDDCMGNPTEYIKYSDDQCALGDGTWSYVECGEDVIINSDTTYDPTVYPTADPTEDQIVDGDTVGPSSHPTNYPTTKDPSNDPTTYPTSNPTLNTMDPTQLPSTEPTKEPTDEMVDDQSGSFMYNVFSGYWIKILFCIIFVQNM